MSDRVGRDIPRRGGRGPARGMPVTKPQNAKKAIRRLFSYLEGDIPKLCVVLVCVIVTTIANLAGSYMLRPIINSLTDPSGTPQKLFRSLVVMAGIYLVAVAGQYLQQRVMIGVSQGALERMRNDLSSVSRNCRCVSMTPMPTAT